MPYRILIVPITTESGFKDRKNYEVQKEITKKRWFKKNIVEWVTISAYDNIGQANKLLKEKLELEGHLPSSKPKNPASGYSGYSGFSGKR